MDFTEKKFRPLLILAAVIAYKWIKASGQTLGTRTMSVIDDFTKGLMPTAKAVENETGISAVLGVGEAAHESGWGQSGLTKEANNIFGFTAELGTYWRTQSKPFITMPTHEWIKQPDGSSKEISTARPFRRYTSWEESYRDWARLMQTDRYVKAGVLIALKKGDAQAFGNALNTAGYATDPAYGSKVASVVARVSQSATSQGIA